MGLSSGSPSNFSLPLAGGGPTGNLKSRGFGKLVLAPFLGRSKFYPEVRLQAQVCNFQERLCAECGSLVENVLFL